MADRLAVGIIGLHLGSNADPAALARRAQLAEEAGVESLWVGDHIVLPADINQAEVPRLEAVVTVSYLAAVTTSVRLGFGVLVLPQRQPVLLAKQLSSIDTLSGGRLTVGIGVGYLEPELRALGASLADRGARTDESLAAMQALWTERAPSFAGRSVSFDQVTMRPVPTQQPHPPIVVGGHSPAAFRRAIRSGHGWYGVYLGVEETADHLAELRTTAAGLTRPPALGELEITITPPPGPIDAATARRYADLGVHRLVLRPDSPGEVTEEFLTQVGDTLIGRV